jgi:hypothetical protein
MKLSPEKIQLIALEEFEGYVYNLELETNAAANEDDLFWVGNNILTHNCFPKDINSLIYLLENLGVDPKVLKGVWEKNLEVRPQRDWEKLKGRAISEE